MCARAARVLAFAMGAMMRIVLIRTGAIIVAVTGSKKHHLLNIFRGFGHERLRPEMYMKNCGF